MFEWLVSKVLSKKTSDGEKLARCNANKKVQVKSELV